MRTFPNWLPLLRNISAWKMSAQSKDRSQTGLVPRDELVALVADALGAITGDGPER
jgi:hypothetical protein